MNDRDLIICSKSILTFLINSDKEFIQLGTFNVPSYITMNIVLNRYNTNMCDFTQILNKRVHLLNEPLWLDSPIEFFRNHGVSEKFFNVSISILSRRNKIIKLKEKMYGKPKCI